MELKRKPRYGRPVRNEERNLEERRTNEKAHHCRIISKAVTESSRETGYYEYFVQRNNNVT